MRKIEFVIDTCASCPFIEGHNPYTCPKIKGNPVVLIDHEPFPAECPLKAVTVEEYNDSTTMQSWVRYKAGMRD